MKFGKQLLALALLAITAFAATSFAQGLNWEGQSGALLTPFAYTAGAPANKFGKPEIAFHYLDAGNVIGNLYQFSITEGFGKRFEAGFTQALSSSGSVGDSGSGNYPPSYLFGKGFTALHGKFELVNENAGKTKWVPAIAVGAIGRFGDERVTWAATAASASVPVETNGDFYIVATKTVTQIKGLPLVFSVGDKVTNASLLGIAGDAGSGATSPTSAENKQLWQGRAFGAVAFVITGPKKAALIFGSEVVQQPNHIQGLPQVASVPTSESYFVRVIPKLEGSPLAVDLGVVHAAGKIVNVPGNVLDVNANLRVGVGVSYHF